MNQQSSLLNEPLDVINKRLIDYYGKFPASNDPHFRIVWSSDEYENRLVNQTPEGFYLQSPRIMHVPKYSYARDRYILEKITPVPQVNQLELPVRLSYEPIWVFEDNAGNPLPVKWEAIVVIFEAIAQAMDPKSSYKQDEKEGNTTEALEAKVKILEEQLYGNETSVGDALSTNSGVGYGKKSEPRQRNLHNPIKE